MQLTDERGVCEFNTLSLAIDQIKGCFVDEDECYAEINAKLQSFPQTG
jgi:hypothetical protein